MIPLESITCETAILSLKIPIKNLINKQYISKNESGTEKSSQFSSDPPSDKHVLWDTANNGWLALQASKTSAIRIKPNWKNTQKIQLQDNRKFSNNNIEIQIYAQTANILQPNEPIIFEFTIQSKQASKMNEWLKESNQTINLPEANTIISSGSANIKSVTCHTPSPTQHQLIEYTIDLDANYTNPFDPDDVKLDAIFTHETGQSFRIPAFFNVKFQHSLQDNKEHYTHDNSADWQLRFRPPLSGKYTYTLTLNDGTTTHKSSPSQMFVASNPDKGFIQISPSNPLTFSFNDGSPYIPIGANVAWSTTSGVFDFEQYWQSLAQNNANYARIWIAPTFSALSLSRPAETNRPTTGPGVIDQLAASRIDKILQYAEQNDIYIMLCIESYNSLNDNAAAHGKWHESIYNIKNGGPLESPSQFWTNPTARKYFRDRLRYLIARYGHSHNIFAWELWNEVEFTNEWPEHLKESQEWHQTMAKYIKKNDPYEHLVTTSAHEGDTSLSHYLLDEIDFSQSHNYNSSQLAPTIRKIATFQTKKFNKPHIMGEMGIAHSGQQTNKDPEGIHFHNMIWAGLFTETPSTAMSWWWDNYLRPLNLWTHLKPASKFIQNAPVNNPNSKALNFISASFTKPLKDPHPAMIRIQGDTRLWSQAPSNQPTIIIVDKNTIQGNDHLSGILHGSTGKPELANPLTIKIDYEMDGEFAVNIAEVSGWGGAKLKVYLDQKLLIDEDFADPDGDEKTEVLKQYAGRYAIPVPAGKHEIQIINDGKDWAMIDYEIVSPWLRDTPWIDLHGRIYPSTSQGQPTVIGWIRNQDYSWTQYVNQRNIEPLNPIHITLNDIPSAYYQLILFDTISSDVTEAGQYKAENQSITIEIPSFKNDIAFKLYRIQE
ncbi:DUF5060 domain-containing protein [Planctomycetota bacterium]|nr:DUF5060 domain-containing protein [Planctomycetota bacterium]